ncbi:MAG: class I SAM-dependent methyltransferase [Syntrophomonadaceae bacterium]|nr:class I SAM-dependent methyltransferase [Syntrophomonadaceae bacterium]
MSVNYDSWNEYAKEFNQLSSFDPQLIHLGLGIEGIKVSELVTQPDMNILDVGCGNGKNTYLLAQATNGQVDGIDMAKSAIIEANERYCRPNIAFTPVDFYEHNKLCGIKYDLVTFFGSIDYIVLQKEFFSVLNRITNDEAICYISKFHPFWTALFENDVSLSNQKSYFENGRIDEVIYGQSNRFVFQRYHYTFEHLFSSFKSGSWVLMDLKEPKPAFSKAAFAYNDYDKDEVLRKRMENIPMTLILKFKKTFGR